MTLPILVVAGLLMLLGQIEAFCRGTDYAAVSAWLGGACLLIGLFLRPHLLRLPELRSLPHGRGHLFTSDVMIAGTAAIPVLLMVIAGSVHAAWEEDPTGRLARGAILACTCVATIWLVAGCGPSRIGAAWLRLGGWPGALRMLVEERFTDTLLRLLISLIITGGGWWFIRDHEGEGRPLGLVLICGLAGLASGGMVHLEAAFRAVRQELLCALPITTGRWFLLSMILPVGIQCLIAVGLGTACIVAGSPPSRIVIAVLISLVMAVVTLLLRRRWPDNGGVIALLATILIARASAMCLA